MSSMGIARTSTGETVVLTRGLAIVAGHVARHGSATYGSLARSIKLPLATIYVYAQRLERAGVVWRETTQRDGKPHTRVKLRDGAMVISGIRKV